MKGGKKKAVDAKKKSREYGMFDEALATHMDKHYDETDSPACSKTKKSDSACQSNPDFASLTMSSSTSPTKLDSASKSSACSSTNKSQLEWAIELSEAELATLSRAERARRSEAKQKGDEAFASDCFDEAVVFYSRALAYCDGEASSSQTGASNAIATLNNRALAHLRRCDTAQCVADCDAVLRRDPANVKALLRKAYALLALVDDVHSRNDVATLKERTEVCRAALVRLLRVEPDNTLAQSAFALLASNQSSFAASASKALSSTTTTISNVGTSGSARPYVAVTRCNNLQLILSPKRPTVHQKCMRPNGRIARRAQVPREESVSVPRVSNT